mmetsp:Transcript_6598/g.9635  ORF Transcript_6598/g.9635 Transcript_6598/m.9635 type:complete len:202 (+) Transcript_6598:330-935(+)
MQLINHGGIRAEVNEKLARGRVPFLCGCMQGRRRITGQPPSGVASARYSSNNIEVVALNSRVEDVLRRISAVVCQVSVDKVVAHIFCVNPLLLDLVGRGSGRLGARARQVLPYRIGLVVADIFQNLECAVGPTFGARHQALGHRNVGSEAVVDKRTLRANENAEVQRHPVRAAVPAVCAQWILVHDLFDLIRHGVNAVVMK